MCVWQKHMSVSQLQEATQEMTRKNITINYLKKNGVTKMADIDSNSQNHGNLDYEKKCCP
jgi:hypothetical protein